MGLRHQPDHIQINLHIAEAYAYLSQPDKSQEILSKIDLPDYPDDLEDEELTPE